ncbi:Crp/Fnr family transcriptional regulator [Saccharibacillus sp. JS10]|uniref:Crp/Fnr family transcriptional regulator n=1 Tax=Saccharibacillus sp. JS10 TaxID=2950552 RepID=UPI00210C1A87|nr:Crp/Fnr family transcriptional regulator [Saccharibacillus sp. JS10]MCQ4087819.1 Crp/Fnr family transcriptional regulator [Saccharibacillus sp. JS10]
MSQPEIVDQVKNVLPSMPFFQSLADPVWNEVEKWVTPENIDFFAKDHMIQTPDDQREGIFFVIEGSFHFYKINAEGKQHTVCIVNEGGMFGEIPLFSLGTRGTYTEATADAIVFSIPTEPFEQLLRKHPELAIRLLSELSHRLSQQEELVDQLVFQNLRGKVLYFLQRVSKKLNIQENEHHELNIPLTHQELADMIGATREAVSLTLKELAQEGVLTTSRGNIRVHTRQVLQERS